MSAYVAPLRAVKVSGTGTLPMAQLVAMTAALGLNSIHTHRCCRDHASA
ncbi:DUF1697 domain-containing protein [Stenotrophomonas sp. NPDC077659]